MQTCANILCFDAVLITKRSECDRFACEEGQHVTAFSLYYHKSNQQYFYCVNRKQLGQYWRCMVNDRDKLCPGKCDNCQICKEMSDMYCEL